MAKVFVLGTVVPSVRYSVIDGTKWRTVFTGPETPLSQRTAQKKAGKGALLWVREPGLPARPLR